MADPRPLYEIAAEIRKVWKKPAFGAEPYLSAMVELKTIRDKVMHDDGKHIVLRFLSNALTFKGEDARRIKKELREHIENENLTDRVEQSLRGPMKPGTARSR